MNAVLENLLRLQALEFGEVTGKNVEAQIQELRKIVPQPFLGHYDRLRLREKKGVALIRNSVCTGCHMLQPIGKVTIVMRGEDIQLCDSCGRYLYIVDAPAPAAEASPAPAEKPVEVKKVRKPRKAKQPKPLKAAAAP
jgi:predicted  nucleic acid-binding Zn-ribbon protein